MLAALGVPFVRHGDAPDHIGRGRFAQLTDLGALQLIDLVADARQRPADHAQHTAELRDPVA